MANDTLTQIDDEALDQVSGGTGDLSGAFGEYFRDFTGVAADLVEIVTHLPTILSNWFGG